MVVEVQEVLVVADAGVGMLGDVVIPLRDFGISVVGHDVWAVMSILFHPCR